MSAFVCSLVRLRIQKSGKAAALTLDPIKNVNEPLRIDPRQVSTPKPPIRQESLSSSLRSPPVAFCNTWSANPQLSRRAARDSRQRVRIDNDKLDTRRRQTRRIRSLDIIISSERSSYAVDFRQAVPDAYECAWSGRLRFGRETLACARC
jgi:hypothetical protein